jgi:hypothetical protein
MTKEETKERKAKKTILKNKYLQNEIIDERVVNMTK